MSTAGASSLPIVMVTEGSAARPLAWLRQHATVIEASADDPAHAADLAAAAGLVIRTYTRVNDQLLDRAPSLKVVGRGGVGIDNIDVSACRRRGVEVVYTPDANTIAVGDFVFGQMLQLIRPWCAFRERAFTPAQFKQMRQRAGRQLNELTLGVLGMGRVGRRVGRIAATGFGMRVIYNDLLDVEALLDFAATAVDKPTLYREWDMRPGNENLVGRQQLEWMKPDALLINTSRGEVLDAHALADAVRTGRLAGAALDVFAPEPPPADFPLLGMENVLLTPHMASRTHTAMENMSWVVRDVVAVLQGRSPTHPAP